MTPNRSQQVEEIFQAAVALAPDERERYLCVACNDDDTLKQDVESRLLQHDSAARKTRDAMIPKSIGVRHRVAAGSTLLRPRRQEPTDHQSTRL